MDEVWQNIAGYEGLYQVSDLGRVRSLDRVVLRSGKPLRLRGRILQAGRVKAGYLLVVLCREGREVSRFVHDLVLETFRGPPSRRQQCRHLNGDPSDARLENLAWGTPVQNQADRVLHGTSNRGSRNGQSKLSEADALEIRHLWGTGDLSLQEIGNRFQVSKSAVWGIVHGKDWSHLPAV